MEETKQEKEKEIKNQTKKANPAPLGLLGFGMTTILLNLHNTGLFDLNIMIAAMGFAMGGTAQIIAGILEFRQEKTFGGTAFTAYGFFWWSLVLIWWNPFKLTEANGIGMGSYFIIWCVFSCALFVCTFKNKVIIEKILFGSLTLLFLMLAIASFVGVQGVWIATGVIGLICGTSALYSALAQLYSAETGRKLFLL